ncbi:PREDICTED: uncharacterized protein LOC109155341 [Ipomoea nil]|uniref:uncharacterized protein LOC109155341 n=1 Tax=Ipomoea nil TaxID=35883 RepID=UPI0009020197|nr:PREDICTED: uncharacterized protein LOC109155341 [Ipomoea nil]
MADAVRNIIIKLGRKVHSPETATKHVKTLLQLAMKKKLKLDPDLRDEIVVIVFSDYPEFYADWSDEDTSDLLMLASDASDDVSPASIPEPEDGNRAGAFLQYFAQRALESEEVSRRRVAAQPLYLQTAQKEATHRIEILCNRSNTSEAPIEISHDKPDDLISDAIESALPVVQSDNENVFLSEKSSVSDDPFRVSSKNLESAIVVPNSDSDDKVDNLSLVVYSADVARSAIPVLPTSDVAKSPVEVCPVDVSPKLDSDDEKILAEVYGPQAQLSGPLTVEATAHPDSTTFKIREVSKLLGSSSAPVSETSHSVSPSPTNHSPSRETRKSKRKGIPERVAVETGNDNLDMVFKTLRSSVKNKAPATVSTTSTRKMKPTIRSRGRSVTPDVQAASDNPDTSIYKPQFVSARAQGKWSTMVRRELIVQRSVDENQLNSVCDILPLLSEVGLMKTITFICPYSKILTYEFFCNLNEEIDNLSRTRCMQIFIRGKWYVFGPDVINEYYGLKAVDEEEITDWDLVARTLTSGQTPVWPTGDVDTLSSSKLTSKYVILHRIALHNWLPSAHFHTVSKQLAALLFRIGTKMTIDLGKWIFYHFLTLIHPREQNARLPYPNLIFGVLTTQGLVPMPSEIICPTLLYTVDPRLLTCKHIRYVTPVAAPPSSDADTHVDDSPHARDIQLSLRLKAQVSELETVNGIIAKQLTAARTELAIVLLRLSLTESAAAENVKSDSDELSNA